MGGAAFFYTNISSFTVPQKVTAINDGTFISSPIKSIKLNEQLRYIGAGVFAMSELEEIVIPDSVTYIGEDAFASCAKLKSVTLGKMVRTIDKRAFSYCKNIQSITIPSSVTTIGEQAFVSCSNLKTIYNYAFKPQKVSPDLFSEEVYPDLTREDIVVHVYKGMKDDYIQNGWSIITVVDDITPPEITKVNFGKEKYTIGVEEYGMMTVTTDCDSIYCPVTYSVSDENILVIDDVTGEMYGLSEGEVTVTVRVAGTDVTNSVIVVVSNQENDDDTEDNGNNDTNAIDTLDSDNNPNAAKATKRLINGKIVIIRNGKQYNISGL